jgi:hypothetical protein
MKADVKRLCVFAHFDKHNIIQDYVIYYLENLKKYRTPSFLFPIVIYLKKKFVK